MINDFSLNPSLLFREKPELKDQYQKLAVMACDDKRMQEKLIVGLEATLSTIAKATKLAIPLEEASNVSALIETSFEKFRPLAIDFLFKKIYLELENENNIKAFLEENPSYSLTESDNQQKIQSFFSKIFFEKSDCHFLLSEIAKEIAPLKKIMETHQAFQESLPNRIQETANKLANKRVEDSNMGLQFRAQAQESRERLLFSFRKNGIAVNMELEEELKRVIEPIQIEDIKSLVIAEHKESFKKIIKNQDHVDLILDELSDDAILKNCPNTNAFLAKNNLSNQERDLIEAQINSRMRQLEVKWLMESVNFLNRKSPVIDEDLFSKLLQELKTSHALSHQIQQASAIESKAKTFLKKEAMPLVSPLIEQWFDRQFIETVDQIRSILGIELHSNRWDSIDWRKNEESYSAYEETLKKIYDHFSLNFSKSCQGLTVAIIDEKMTSLLERMRPNLTTIENALELFCDLKFISQPEWEEIFEGGKKAFVHSVGTFLIDLEEKKEERFQKVPFDSMINAPVLSPEKAFVLEEFKSVCERKANLYCPKVLERLELLTLKADEVAVAKIKNLIEETVSDILVSNCRNS